MLFFMFFQFSLVYLKEKKEVLEKQIVDKYHSLFDRSHYQKVLEKDFLHPSFFLGTKKNDKKIILLE